MAELRIGTSGWSYDHWDGIFYPKGVSASERLAYYATHFSTVEINATFYRLPSEHAVDKWRKDVPDGFLFAVKGSQFITHFRRLENIDERLEQFLGRVGRLGEKLGPLLWQLPPSIERDDDLLERFLEKLADTGLEHAIEFRDNSWLARPVFELLRAHNVACVNVSGGQLREDHTPTADFVYGRFHGGVGYHGEYRHADLEPWRSFLAEQLSAGRDCYAYFNNDAGGHAPADAERLIGMLSAANRK
ncbi:MAG: DUF72 domain-containing protein [Coriobacteriia bacterium]